MEPCGRVGGERDERIVLIWSSLGLHDTYSGFIRGQRWSLMSAALAVIGVTVFVCLTLCKRGLRRRDHEDMERGEEGVERKGDRGRESSRPSQLGYGTAAWTNPWASETTVLNSRYLVSACPERGPLHQYVPLPLSAPDIFILSGPLLWMFHLNGFRLCSACPVQMDRRWSVRCRPSRLDAWRRWGESTGGGVKAQRGRAEGSLMSTCILRGPHYTDASGEAFRG